MKIKLLLIIFVTASLILSSCTKDNDNIYSCNPLIDQWVKGNLEDISKMTRSDFLKFDDNAQRAIYRAMSHEQQYNIWKEKITNLLTLEWTIEERTHLENLLVSLKENKSIFNKTSQQEDEDKFILSIYRWSEYAKDALGWDSQTLYLIIANPNDVIKITTKSGSTHLSIPKKSRLSAAPKVLTRAEGPTEEEACSCSTESDHCASREDLHKPHECKKVPCKASDSSCGNFWQYKCNGLCRMK